jgi:hypothetical protein
MTIGWQRIAYDLPLTAWVFCDDFHSGRAAGIIIADAAVIVSLDDGRPG